MLRLPPQKPWSVDVFQEFRPGICEFVDHNISPLIRCNECSRVLIRAPVKSGKREIAEYIALRDQINGEPRRVHAFVSAWHRKADDEQRDELRQHNLEVFSIINRKEADSCIRWIENQTTHRREVVIHLDECDHGTGTRQILGRIWRHIREHGYITTILYSATPEEVLYSDEIDVDGDFTDMIDTLMNTGCYLRYNPEFYNPRVSLTTGYCGPRAFLEAGLVTDATPFFRIDSHGNIHLSTQGLQIITDLQHNLVANPNRNLNIVRLSYSVTGSDRDNRKDNKAIYQFFKNLHNIPELVPFLIMIDKDENFDIRSQRIIRERIQWSNPEYWRRQAPNIPTLIILDQTSTRSTEWACHDRIYAVHDFRNTLQFGTVSQAQERVNHYANKYGEFQPIRVFGSLKTFQLSAGVIDYETYLANEWEMRKVDRRRSGNNNDMYEVKNTLTRELHPECSVPVTRDEAERILQENASFANKSISARVRGAIKNVAIVQTTWHECNEASFDEVSQTELFRAQTLLDNGRHHTFQNPFSNPRMDGNRTMGYLREWKVFEYADIEYERWGFNMTTNHPRITICYNNNRLGVALRSLSGFETQNTLTAFKTMYKTNSSGN